MNTLDPTFQLLASVFGPADSLVKQHAQSGASKRKSRPVKRIITEEVIQDEEEEVEPPSEEVQCPVMQLDTTDSLMTSIPQFPSDESGEACIREDDENGLEEAFSNGNGDDMEHAALTEHEFLKSFVAYMNSNNGNGSPITANLLQQQLESMKELPSESTPMLTTNGNGLLTPIATPLSPLYTSTDSVFNTPEKLLQAIMTPSIGFLNGLGASNSALLSSPLIAPSPTLMHSFMNTPTTPTASLTPKKAENRPPVVSQTLKASKRRLFDDTSRMEAASMNGEDRIDMNELEAFAQTFKKQRIKFGFTQGDVGVALGKRYGTDFSQTTISRFEALNLSFKNMCKLRPLLKEWLADVESAIEAGATITDLIDKKTVGNHNGNHHSTHDCHSHESPISSLTSVSANSLVNRDQHVKRRRKRTNLDMNQRNALDTFFTLNPRPDHDRMTDIANTLELDRDVVRVWFCNRRQKMRRVDEPVEGEIVTPSVSPVFPNISSMSAMEQIQEAARLASSQISNDDSDGTSGSPDAPSNDGCSDL